MPLCGSSVPIEVKPGDKPVAVLVICPNEYAHSRLMQALNGIVPEAGVPTQYHAIEAPMPPVVLMVDDDEPPLRACPTGTCGMDD